MARKKPTSKIGADTPDMTKGNKHVPKIRGAVKPPDPHAGHGHKGKKT
jgi:hypothetical protein